MVVSGAAFKISKSNCPGEEEPFAVTVTTGPENVGSGRRVGLMGKHSGSGTGKGAGAAGALFLDTSNCTSTKM
jgi:hypothetical protein